jgi:signal transduction histidine kinase
VDEESKSKLFIISDQGNRKIKPLNYTSIGILKKYESGKQQLQLSSVGQLNVLPEDAVQSIKPPANEKFIQTEIKIPDSMFLVQCDEALIMQVLTNLLVQCG